MSALPLAGAIFFAALPLALIALGLLHYLHAKVNAMSVVDDFKALGDRLLAVVAKLEGLDPAAFVEKVQADAAAVAAAAEAELQPVIAAFEAPIATLETAVAKIEALVHPPAPEPAAEPAPAEQPAA